MKLREAVLADAPALWALRNAAFRQGCVAIYDSETLAAFTPDEMPLGQLHAIRDNPYFVIEDEEKQLIAASGFLDMSNHFVEGIFTHPDYIRQGLASRIMQAIIDEAQQREIKILQLDATPNAVPFYQTLGFVITGNTPYYSSSAKRYLESVQMTLALACTE